MRLTEHMIMARSKQSDISVIKCINLWGCELTDISIVAQMKNLEVLALSINNLSSLQHLETCSKLQILYLRKNNISNFNELKYLQNLPKLSELWLAENPCANRAGSHYRACVIKMLPKLKKLDNEDISRLDIEEAEKLDPSKINMDYFAFDLPMEGPKVSEATNHQIEDNDYNQQPQSTGPPPESARKMRKPEQQEVQDQGHIVERIQKNPRPGVSYKFEPNFETQRQSGQHSEDQMSHGDHENPRSQQSCPVSNIQRPEDQMAHGGQQSLPSCNRSDTQDQPQDAAPAKSSNQVSKLKLVLQIQNSQSARNKEQQKPQQQHQHLNIDSSEWKDQNGSEGTPRSHLYDFYTDHVAHTKQKGNFNCIPQGARTSRATAQPPMQKNDSGWDSYSHTSNRHSSSRSRSERRYPPMDGSQSHRGLISNLEPSETSSWAYSILTNRSQPDTASQASESKRRSTAVLSALLVIVPELDVDSLQVLEHSIQCRLDELDEIN